MDRLSTFQNACFWSVNPNTHKIDKWMVKFLLAHALALDEKTEKQNHPELLLSITDVPPHQAQRLSERGQFTTTALTDLLME
jgi:hypothetical protein